METKTIRFEKGHHYEHIHFVPDICNGNFKFNYEHMVYECLKSFTVQINIIEDEKVKGPDECPHDYTYAVSGGSKCKYCGEFV